MRADVATGKRAAQVMELDDAPKPKRTQGAPLLYCCTVKTTVASYIQK